MQKKKICYINIGFYFILISGEFIDVQCEIFFIFLMHRNEDDNSLFNDLFHELGVSKDH